jgi:hypothetical protein
MKKITAKPINNQSWILNEWGNRIGVLTCSDNEWTVLETTELKKYKSLENIQTEKNWKIVFEEKELKEEAVDKIQQMPIKHTSPQNIEFDPVISYTKTPTSNIRFAAGYWGIKFANGFTPVFCPKIETTKTAESVGPFTSKIEMNTIIAQKNQKTKGAA